MMTISQKLMIALTAAIAITVPAFAEPLACSVSDVEGRIPTVASGSHSRANIAIGDTISLDIEGDMIDVWPGGALTFTDDSGDEVMLYFCSRIYREAGNDDPRRFVGYNGSLELELLAYPPDNGLTKVEITHTVPLSTPVKTRVILDCE